MKRSYAPFIPRFWSRVDKIDGCWLWQAGKTKDGYGVIWKAPKVLLAHRVAWELTYGPIPEGLQILHHCDNPACVNPTHLFIGTNYDNVCDSVSKGRRSSGENHPNALLTTARVSEIRKIYALKGNRCTRDISQRKLAYQYGVNRRTIQNILSRKNWR